MIYLITGKKRAGKDTLGDIATEMSDNCFKESLAQPMKDIAEFLFPWGTTEMNEEKEKVDPGYGISPRQFLQVFGTDFMQTYLSEKFPEYKQKVLEQRLRRKIAGRIRTRIGQALKSGE